MSSHVWPLTLLLLLRPSWLDLIFRLLSWQLVPFNSMKTHLSMISHLVKYQLVDIDSLISFCTRNFLPYLSSGLTSRILPGIHCIQAVIHVNCSQGNWKDHESLHHEILKIPWGQSDQQEWPGPNRVRRLQEPNTKIRKKIQSGLNESFQYNLLLFV